MIFFENCLSFFGKWRYLSIDRKLVGHFFRPPRSFSVLLFGVFLLFSFRVAAVQVTLNLKSVPLETAFAELKKQSGYGFWYEKKDLGEVKVSISVKNVGIREAMDLCLKGLPLSYEIFDKTVVVKRKVLVLPSGAVPRRGGVQDKVKGKVVDAQTKEPLAGVLVMVKSPAMSVITNDKGEFELLLPAGKYELLVQYLGYATRELEITAPSSEEFLFAINPSENTLEEVKFVSTGYQSLPKERATGSFVQIDNELLHRNGVSTSLLERIDGITSGVIFNNNNFDGNGNRQARQSTIEVRGRPTLFSPAQPLVIVDNFPYDGDLTNINPNDIENVTVLKDAAAASAWGARSGNGVIVITTKKGKLNSSPKVSFNSSLNMARKPDLYSVPQLSSAEFIEVQQLLFARGAYNTTINNGYGALAPAVEVMLARRNGTITESEERMQLDLLSGYDVREQLLTYNYRKALQQQYQSSISGGTSNQKYFVSLGYNNNQNGIVNSSYERLTFNASNTYYFLKNRLELFSNIIYTGSKSKAGQSLDAVYPYRQFADANGNSLFVERDLRIPYASTAGNGKLLNWLYSPLDEVRNGYSTSVTDLTSYRLNFSLGYTLLKGIRASALYGYEKGQSDGNTLHEVESYFARNAINRLSQINATSGAVTYPMPMGGILNNSLGDLKTHNGRLQVNYSQDVDKHAINVLFGAEIKDQNSFRTATSWYGYDPETGLNQNGSVSYTTNYPLFFNPSSTSRINPNASKGGTTNRFFSYYFNGSYIYDERYIASLSARRDESNLFGVATNQKGVPLWSAGLAWNLDKESFFHVAWLPQLKLRSTFGYTGNVNNSISAYLTATNMIMNDYGANYASIVNPPNPDLRWEKISNLNIGLDFTTKRNRFSGSIDFWRKKGLDLIGNSPIAPQTGISLYTGNSANTLTQGVDLVLHSIHLDGVFKWQTSLLYNYTTSRVTDYKVSNGRNLDVVSANYNNPLEGYPYYALFSLRYAGLNSAGAPQGYLNGEVSTNYTGIVNSTDRSQLVYHGSAVPTSFGSLRNTFSYKSLDISFNILYKFGYYFRRNSLNNSTLYSTGSNYKIADYNYRWKQVGDEAYTTVPALVYPAVTNRTNLYTNADILVERGDHIRLQDFRIGYTLSARSAGNKLPFKNINIFSYMNNLGLLWRANKRDIDPDSPTGLRNAYTLAFGLRADL